MSLRQKEVFVGTEHDKHLLGILKEFYNIEENWMDHLYGEITLNWHLRLEATCKLKRTPPKQAQHGLFE